jgi:hypothetical protein
MIRKTILVAGVVALAAATVQAQDPRVELSGTAGWTFSDGVNVGSIDDSPITVGPKDAFSWGARLGFMVTPNVEIGGLFNLQSTDFEVEGFGLTAAVSQKVYNYHGYVAYNFGESDAPVLPYVLGGGGVLEPVRALRRHHAAVLGREPARQCPWEGHCLQLAVVAGGGRAWSS